jgi:sarcosine oxidase subunit gamma
MRSRVLEPCTIIRVQSWDCGVPAPSQVEQVLGFAWPRETGAVASGGADVISTGPTDWLVTTTDPNAGALLQRLEETFDGSAFRATNMSQALCRIEIDGPEARTLLSKGCSLDLHPSRFPPGRAARTRFAGMPVIVRCTQPSTFECIVTSSYLDHLVSWLADAVLEFS